MADVTLQNLVKTFDTVEAVRGIDLRIPNNEFVVLVGPSGCGKSTVLRMIAGLEDITSGDIRIGDLRVNDVPPKDRNIAMVFQNYALYPHMTLEQNMSFGLRLRKVAKSEIRGKVQRAADILGIAELLGRRPRELSGGQRQRVAMGRAIVRDPQVFLFDEPLSNLDAKLRGQMRIEIQRLHQQLRTTTIYVTHDQVEAMTLADRVVVMNAGRIEQAGTPDEVYHQPRTRFVAGFMGSPAMNFLNCQVTEENGHTVARLADGPALPLPAEQAARVRSYAGRTLVAGLRPENIREAASHDGGNSGGVPHDISIDIVEPLGRETIVYFRLGDSTLCARVGTEVHPRAGERTSLVFHPDRLHLIDPETDLVL
ncbi:MAG: sn-glycerol-3-phosphate ABC transporter ATP-binding protein UgpC [Rhodospirillales bacterium]|nr:sn-glycerol-3-phosphate ABC transporter ATP-binding protein UgpC [Rhodospirillales bacterium]